jgi:hypothetical protein
MGNATLRQRVVNYLLENPGRRFTNGELADILSAPLPSVRRATLKALTHAQIEDGGPTTYNPNIVTYVAPLTNEIHG